MEKANYLYKTYYMGKTVTINENDIRQIVSECLTKVLLEEDEKNTGHFMTTAEKRLYIIDNIIGGAGDVVLTNVLDRGHKDGPERFELTDKGIIFVYNDKTGKRITVLFARHGQIMSRFGEKFNTLPWKLRKQILDCCKLWQYRGYNNI